MLYLGTAKTSRMMHIAVMQATEEVHAAVSPDLSGCVDAYTKRDDSQKNAEIDV